MARKDKAEVAPKKGKAATAASSTEFIEVRYDLYELPTAQHKAGLAGLLLQIESMNERKSAGELDHSVEIPIVAEPGETGVKIRFTKESIQNIFDDLYAAKVVERRSQAKWAGATELRIESETDPKTGKTIKYFIYEAVEPIGHFLRKHCEGEKESWHKLWREMLWSITRGKPATRGPFNARAEKKPTKDGGDAWTSLLSVEKARGKGELYTVEVAGAILLGAQAVNAELVPFQNRADHAILLHFWTLTARIYVPEIIDSDGNSDFKDKFVLAIPEVSNLLKFCEAYKKALGQLNGAKRGYRPADAIISLPVQGSLEYMRNLEELAERKAVNEGPARYISNVEFFYMLKLGNNVKMQGHGKIPPDARLLKRYIGIWKSFKNPVFLCCRIIAILKNKPWFEEFELQLAQKEWSFFVHSRQEGHQTPPSMMTFAIEAGRSFKSIADEEKKKEEYSMSQTSMAESVDLLIYRLVRHYAHLRTLQRLGISESEPETKWKHQVKDTNGKVAMYENEDYQEARSKVCSTLFLEIRSRRDDDFVSHFTSTFASVAQYLPEDKYALVSAALMRSHTDLTGEDRPRTRDDIKTLTMLALSAHSRSLRKSNKTTENKEEQE